MRVGKTSAALAGMLAAGLAQAQPAAPAETRIVAEAKSFMADYSRDLLAGDRAAIARRYSAGGAYTLGIWPKRFESRSAIAGGRGPEEIEQWKFRSSIAAD